MHAGKEVLDYYLAPVLDANLEQEFYGEPAGDIYGEPNYELWGELPRELLNYLDSILLELLFYIFS